MINIKYLVFTFWQVQNWICCKTMNLSDPCWLLKEWHSIGSPICETNVQVQNQTLCLSSDFLEKILTQKVIGNLKWFWGLQLWLVHLIIEKVDKRSDWNPCSSQTHLICFSEVLSVKHSWNLNILYLPTYLAGAFWPSVWCKGLIKRGSTWCQIVCLCLV